MRISEVESLVKSENGRNLYKTGDEVTVRISYEVKQKVEDVAFGFEIRNAEGVKCYATNSRIDYADRIDLDKDGTIDLKFDSVLLIPGKYKMDLSITTIDGFPLDNFQNAFEFEMYSERCV